MKVRLEIRDDSKVSDPDFRIHIFEYDKEIFSIDANTLKKHEFIILSREADKENELDNTLREVYALLKTMATRDIYIDIYCDDALIASYGDIKSYSYLITTDLIRVDQPESYLKEMLRIVNNINYINPEDGADTEDTNIQNALQDNIIHGEPTTNENIYTGEALTDSDVKNINRVEEILYEETVAEPEEEPEPTYEEIKAQAEQNYLDSLPQEPEIEIGQEEEIVNGD